jgi:hypothetical protein
VPDARGAANGSPAYLMVTDAGSVAAFGGLHYAGSLNRLLHRPIVAMAEAAGGQGYWLADADGTVFAIGDAHNYGSLPAPAVATTHSGSRAGAHSAHSTRATHAFHIAAMHGAHARHAAEATAPGQRVVDMVATPDGFGYWVVTAGGGVFSFGDARYYGSMGQTPLRAPVVGMATTPDGRGYWLSGADGGVFSFGDAQFMGSATGDKLPAPVTGITATPDGRGYRLVTTGGAVYDFGDATLLGPRRPPTLSSPIVSIANAPSGQGYWLLSATGAVITFGSARDRGAADGTLPRGQRVVGMAVARSTTAGDAVESVGAFGPTSPSKLRAVTPARTRPAVHPVRSIPVVGPDNYPAGAKGFDVSWPQCGRPLPPHATIAVVGVNGGWAFTGNPCFTNEARWAGGNLTTYINLNSPRGPHEAEWSTGPAGKCAPGDLYCESYNYGYKTAEFSVASAADRGAHSQTWWLDVETSSDWSFSQQANGRVVAGAIAALRAQGLDPAVYSTAYQWDIITGGYVPGTAAWYPTGTATKSPDRWCSAISFAGGPVRMVQSQAGRFDGDYSC